MKIGIVTVQDSNNFGSFLQAYALQDVLQTMGHEVWFIRSRSQTYIKRLFYASRPGKRDLLRLPAFLHANLEGRKKYRRFRETQKCFRVMEHYGDVPLDLVVLGSDEIWNVRTAVFRRGIFYGEGMAPVMAYAVSIGDATAQEMCCIPEQAFHRISPVLARDEHTAEFLEKLGIQAPVVCDPTLLVDPAIFRREYTSPLMGSQPYLLVYSYGFEPVLADAIRKFARRRGLRVLSACFPFDWCDGTFECTALDFCAVMERAAFVVTSTFHGTIFSILNHKQFVSLPRSRKTGDLLTAMGLEERLLESVSLSDRELEDKIERPISYQAVDAKIAKNREYSLNCLRKGIEQYEQ